MNRLCVLACVVALTACKSEQSAPTPAPGSAATAPTPPPLPAVDKAALIAGKLPEGDPTTDVVYAQCQICHSVDYLTQQRLGEAAWKKTIEKMRKFGANLSDEEAAAVVSYAGRYWNPELPSRTWPLVAAPVGALPLPAAK